VWRERADAWFSRIRWNFYQSRACICKSWSVRQEDEGERSRRSRRNERQKECVEKKDSVFGEERREQERGETVFDTYLYRNV